MSLIMDITEEQSNRNVIKKNIKEVPTDTPGIYIKTYIEVNLDTMESTKVTKTVYKFDIKGRPYLYGYYNKNSALQKRIKERRNTWIPFGNAKNKNPREYTTMGNDIFMEMVSQKDEEEKKKKLAKKPTASKHKYRINKSKITEKVKEEKMKIASKSEKYVPKFLRDKKPENDSEMKKCDRKLIVKNIPKTFMEDDIVEYIESVVDRKVIRDVYVLRNRKTGESKGMAFITCNTNDTCEKIIRNFHNRPMGQMIVKIEYANRKEKR